MTIKAKSKILRITNSLNKLGVGAWAHYAADAYGRQAWDAVEIAADALIGSRLPPYQGIGYHMRGLAASKQGEGDCFKAMKLYQEAVRLCPQIYRPRVLLSIASASEFIEGDASKYIHVCECLVKSTDVVTRIEAERVLAIQDAADGKRYRAIARLHALYNFAKGRNDLLWLPPDVGNSLAFELYNEGLIFKAQEVMAEVSQSPLMKSRKDWRATANDIASLISDRPAIFFDSNLDLKGTAYRTLLDTLAYHYPDYTVSILDRLTQMAGMGEGRAG